MWFVPPCHLIQATGLEICNHLLLQFKLCCEDVNEHLTCWGIFLDIVKPSSLLQLCNHVYLFLNGGLLLFTIRTETHKNPSDMFIHECSAHENTRLHKHMHVPDRHIPARRPAQPRLRHANDTPHTFSQSHPDTHTPTVWRRQFEGPHLASLSLLVCSVWPGLFICLIK